MLNLIYLVDLLKFLEVKIGSKEEMTNNDPNQDIDWNEEFDREITRRGKAVVIFEILGYADPYRWAFEHIESKAEEDIDFKYVFDETMDYILETFRDSIVEQYREKMEAIGKEKGQ